MFSTICLAPRAWPGLVGSSCPRNPRGCACTQMEKCASTACHASWAGVQARGTRCTLLDGSQPPKHFVTSFAQWCWLHLHEDQRGVSTNGVVPNSAAASTSDCQRLVGFTVSPSSSFHLTHKAALRVEAPSLQQSLGVVRSSSTCLVERTFSQGFRIGCPVCCPSPEDCAAGLVGPLVFRETPRARQRRQRMNLSDVYRCIR